MITVSPVGHWFWEMKRPAARDWVTTCVRDALDAWLVLQSTGIAVGATVIDITVSDEGNLVIQRLRDVRIASPESPEIDAVVRLLSKIDRLGDAKNVSVDVSVPGVCLRGGEEHGVRKLFMVTADAWVSGTTTLTLRTFSDAWMSHDLRGFRQPSVQSENAPRLKAALDGLARLTGAETVPGDPTLYGVPTQVGFEDLPDEDPDLLDSWYMFEIPHRTEMLRAHLPEHGAWLGEADAGAPVRYGEVRSDGRLIGFIWAAIDESAVGYEPYVPCGDQALDAASVWLRELNDVRQSGTAPSDVMTELTERGNRTLPGAVVADSLKRADSLEYVQELSGRE